MLKYFYDSWTFLYFNAVYFCVSILNLHLAVLTRLFYIYGYNLLFFKCMLLRLDSLALLLYIYIKLSTFINQT